jgi:hypothetical protein
MELNELNKLNELNELDLIYKIIDLANLNKHDIEKVLRGEKAAGIRVRSSLQDIKLLCEAIRDKIQIRKNAKWGNKRVFSVEKALKKAHSKEIKDEELIKKRKEERISRILNKKNG